MHCFECFNQFFHALGGRLFNYRDIVEVNTGGVRVDIENWFSRFSGYKHRLVTFEGKYVSELGDEYGWVCNRAAVGFGWKYRSVPI